METQSKSMFSKFQSSLNGCESIPQDGAIGFRSEQSCMGVIMVITMKFNTIESLNDLNLYFIDQ